MKRNTVYITYSDNSSWHGYFVRVPSGKQKLFSVGALGGDSKAFDAASKYRDQECRRLKIPARAPHYRKTFRSSKSGTVGVFLSRCIAVHRYKGRVYRYPTRIWVAGWQVGKNKTKRRRFSINKYGFAEAKRLAKAARAAGIARSGIQ